MRWYVSFDGKTEGPLEEQAVALLASAVGRRLIVADEQTHRWVPVSESPFACHLRDAPIAAATQPKKSQVGVAGPLVGCMFVVAGVVVVAANVLSSDPPPPPPLPSAAPMVASQPPVPIATPQDPIISMSRKSRMKASFEKLGYEFTSAPLESGMPRLMGQHPDNASAVELTGRDDYVERSALMVGFAEDDPQGLAWNTGAIMVFMRDLGWADGIKWITKNVRSGAKINKGGIDYEIVRIADTGVVMITAEPNKGSSEVKRQVMEAQLGPVPVAPSPQSRPGLSNVSNVSEKSHSVMCCDGTPSPSCMCGQGSLRGCCSHHHGVCGCE